jgi:hypothetical protein
MDKKLIDVDPLSGVQTWHYYDDQTNQTVIEEVQDVQPFLETANTLRKDESYSKRGIKNSMWHYAHIPNVLITKFAIEHGVDVFNPAQSREVLKLLNTEYTRLKTTTGTHV